MSPVHLRDGKLSCLLPLMWPHQVPLIPCHIVSLQQHSTPNFCPPSWHQSADHVLISPRCMTFINYCLAAQIALTKASRSRQYLPACRLKSKLGVLRYANTAQRTSVGKPSSLLASLPLSKASHTFQPTEKHVRLASCSVLGVSAISDCAEQPKLPACGLGSGVHTIVTDLHYPYSCQIS